MAAFAVILGCMPSPRTPLSWLFTVLLTGVLAGLLLAVAALPGNLLGGFVAKSVLGAYAELPDALRTPAQPQRSYLYANDGKTLITTFYDVNRTDVPLAEIAPVMWQAIVAAEDRRFYSHPPQPGAGRRPAAPAAEADPVAAAAAAGPEPGPPGRHFALAPGPRPGLRSPRGLSDPVCRDRACLDPRLVGDRELRRRSVPPHYVTA